MEAMSHMLTTFSFVILICLCGQYSILAKIRVPKNEMCSPFSSSNAKIATITRYLNDSIPIFFWHIQKSAGSSFCHMMRQEYQRNNESVALKSPDCNHFKLEKALLSNYSAWLNEYRPLGYRFVAMEPSNSHSETFPKSYRKDQATKVLLVNGYETLLQQKLEASIGRVGILESVWTRMVHVLVLRQPLQMAMSAFKYRFPGFNQSIYGTCLTHNLSPNSCFHELFKLKDSKGYQEYRGSVKRLPLFKQSMFTPMQLNRIRQEILGNFTIDHLSITGDLEDAKKRLLDFHLVIDMSMSEISSRLIQCVLGWKQQGSEEGTDSSRQNVNKKVSSDSIFKILDASVLSKWSQYLHYDQLFYDYAMKLVKAHYESALKEIDLHKSSPYF